MLNQTTITAVRLLLELGSRRDDEPMPLRKAAGSLRESPTYLAKIANQLVRSGIVRARRGVTGGVTLNRPPEEISLLAIVEASQGDIRGDFCHEEADLRKACAFHRAAAELQQAIIGVLSRWSLADLLRCPSGTGSPGCWMRMITITSKGGVAPVARRRRAALASR